MAIFKAAANAVVDIEVGDVASDLDLGLAVAHFIEEFVETLGVAGGELVERFVPVVTGYIIASNFYVGSVELFNNRF